MSEKNITDLSEIENINISEEDLPDVISEQFEAIVDIDKRIVEAENRCATAKETADKMILAKALNQKDAINATQDAVRSLAEAQTALSEAQRMLFENQQKMADGMRYLLVLGASSIASLSIFGRGIRTLAPSQRRGRRWLSLRNIQSKKPPKRAVLYVAERKGFEPLKPY